MLGVMYLLTRGLFPVPFEWGRLARVVGVIGGVAVAGELLLPESGAGGLLSRAAWMALIPAGLWVVGFLTPAELARLRALVARVARRRSGTAPA